jgi:hypothetical protein
MWVGIMVSQTGGGKYIEGNPEEVAEEHIKRMRQEEGRKDEAGGRREG